MTLTVDVQVATEGDDNPDPESIRAWSEFVLNQADENFQPSSQEIEVCVRIVDSIESQTLNFQYRHKNLPTNVLSFPADLPADVPIRHLGDIVICRDVVNDEAQAQGKELRAHWAHMVVHGLLHLLGYDHVDEDDAEIMEGLETRIMIGLLFPPPYQIQTQQ